MRRFGILMAALGLAGCDLDGTIPDGRQAFLADCSACHGRSGEGGAALDLPFDVVPPDLRRLSAGNGGTFPRDRVMSIIDGLNRAPHFSAVMPEFGAQGLGDTVIVETEPGLGTPVPARLLALTDYLQSIQIDG